MTQSVTIATRKSPLALWQAEYVKTQLMIHHQDLNVELLPLSTRGDQLLDRSLTKVGGKGLFVKELEHAHPKQNSHGPDMSITSARQRKALRFSVTSCWCFSCAVLPIGVCSKGVLFRGYPNLSSARCCHAPHKHDGANKEDDAPDQRV